MGCAKRQCEVLCQIDWPPFMIFLGLTFRLKAGYNYNLHSDACDALY